jgi:hypothetical protein
MVVMGVEKRDRGTDSRGAARHTATRQARTRRIAVVFIVGFFCFVIEVVLREPSLPSHTSPAPYLALAYPKGDSASLKIHPDGCHL